MKIGQRVTILGGMSEFVGKTGEIVDTENYGGGKSQTYYRVCLDEPVLVPGVGRVTDDLWQKEFLRSAK
jgi:hypothetical protein